MSDSYRDTVERLFSLQRFGIKLGLVNIARLLKSLGNPRPGERVVIVGGTNGKGSVSAMLEAIGRAGGLTTGLFTSPHLVSFTERLRVNGEPISRADVVRYSKVLWDALEPYREPGIPEPITYFEMLTAMAALYFQENDVDLAIIEVGLGGQLDATNALPRDLVVLTDIAFDHERYLGNTLEQIVHDKTALFRPGCPAVAAGGIDNAAELVAARAEELAAPLELLGRDFDFSPGSGATLNLKLSDGEMAELPVPFAGAHQFRNVAVAVQAALELGISDPAILHTGLASASWPGRMEPFPGAPSYLLDCAHNPHGAEALAASLRPHEPTVWLVAAMADKNVAGIVAPLAPLVSSVICTTLNMDRAVPANDLAALVRPHNHRVTVKADPDDAMAEAARQAGPEGRILVAGSIFLVGHVRGRLTGETGP